MFGEAEGAKPFASLLESDGIHRKSKSIHAKIWWRCLIQRHDRIAEGRDADTPQSGREMRQMDELDRFDGATFCFAWSRSFTFMALSR